MTPAGHFPSGHIVYRYLRVISQIFSSPHLACDNDMSKHKYKIIPKNICYTYLTQRCIVGTYMATYLYQNNQFKTKIHIYIY